MGGRASRELRQQVATSQATIDNLNTAFAQIQEDLRQRRIEVDNYEMQVQTLNDQREAERIRLETELQNANVTIQDLQTSNDEFARQVVDLRNDIDAMREEFQKDREETQKWLKSLQRQNQTLLSTVADQQDTIAKQQGTLDKQHDKLSKQQDQLSTQQDQLCMQQNQLSKQQDNMHQLIAIFLQGQNRSMGSPNNMVIQTANHQDLLNQVRINTEVKVPEDMGYCEN